MPWIHATEVGLPFTDSVWRHTVHTVPRSGDRDAHELALARALDTLLRRAGAGTGTRRECTVAARAAAGTPAHDQHEPRDRPSRQPSDQRVRRWRRLVHGLVLIFLNCVERLIIRC